MPTPIKKQGSSYFDLTEQNASKKIFTNREAYRFLKVEQYFYRYKEWEKLGDCKKSSFNKDSNTLTLDFIRADNALCSMLIQFMQSDTFRVRFNPGKMGKDYIGKNSRTVVQDTTDDLIRILYEKENFQIDVNDLNEKQGVEMITKIRDESGNFTQPVMKVEVNFAPFSIKAYNYIDKVEFLVWETAETSIYFTPNGENDYAIIQAVNKPSSAKYIGFGEQGGQNLTKNSTQANYFNFDNMRYRQVYNQGPLDCREPLYHSDPFFLEFNVLQDKDSVNAIFIDNPGQLFVDIGYLNSNRYMFGSRFGDIDYYFFMGDTPADVIESFTSIVGRSRLKPRYCLGYHQGCYGYDSRSAVEWAVNKYREYNIPLDGMHIDVDIQHNYQTFTIDESKFPNPKEMFTQLKKKGIKCSTNITPVISNQDMNYSTYKEALDKGYFVEDQRYEPDDPDSKKYQLYGGGYEYQSNQNDYVEGFNSGQPYIGGVYYGDDISGKQLGTAGHYADLGRSEVRKWWGTQYQYLFEMGLEMVWQDMTTPAIRDFRGDMKGFPFKLLVTDDFTSDSTPKLTPAIKVWNLYSYNLHKATYHGLNNLKGLDEQNRKRNFILGRGSYTGAHRFAGLWTGDNSSDWDFLKMNVSQALSLGMCGVVINGQDIGGFETSQVDDGKWASPELLIRWTSAGAFLPWFRNHYVRKGRKEFQEPFMYVEWFNQYRDGNLPEPQDLYRNVLPICKHYIELRYRLLQLFYDAMFANTFSGLPICRPLFLNDSHDKALYNDKLHFIDNEFFVGRDLLVAPVLEPEVQDGKNNYGKRDVYLPTDSNWYCFMNNTMPLSSAVEGGTTIRDFDAGLSLRGGYDPHINFIVPIFVREGAIIPTIELEQYVGQLNDEGKANPVTLNIYPGDNGNYTMYLDDGVSRASASTVAHPANIGGDSLAANQYREIKISHKYISDNKKTREIILECTNNGYTPKYEKYLFVSILHDPSENKDASGCIQKVGIGGQDARLIQGGSVEDRSNALNASSDNAWYYNENINISFIKVMDDFKNNPKVSITIDYV
jgi:alpha-glucosidase